jgi:2-keto-4-pentenoate hydratase
MSNVISAAADFLAGHRFDQTTFAHLPEAVRPATLADGYRVQSAVVTRLLARGGGAPVGYKIACTSQLAREALNVPHPLFGRLLSFSTHAAPVTLPAAAFTTRTIEPEFGFQLAVDVPRSDTPYTVERIRPFVGLAFPSIEIVNHRFEDWSAVGANTVAADNAIHGAWVFGAGTDRWRELDLAAQTVRLYANDRLVREGAGSAALDHPLNALAWLANALGEHGLSLKQGDYVTTGVVCDVYPGVAGEALVADFGELGSVALSFA